MATLKRQAPGTPIDTRVDNKPAPPVDAVEQAALDAQNQPEGDQAPAGYKYGSTTDSSTGKPELIKAPVVTTTETRNKAQENADYINNKATGGKTVVSTSTSNGKTTTTYSDGTTTTTDSGISPTSGTPTRQDNLNETKNIYDEQEKLQADTNKRYDDLKVSSDDAYNQLVENTKKQFEITRVKLNDSNRRYEGKTKQLQYLNNGFRYTPQQSEGMLYDVEQAGIAKLGELNFTESVALQKALEAKNTNDYKALADQTTAIRAIQTDRLNTIAAMNNQIKVIEDTDKSIRNMNENEATIMQSMINSYTLTSREMPASDTDAFYEKKAKELTELMGFNVAKEFVKAQVEGSKAEADITYSDALSKKNGYHSDVYGRPMLNSEGKTIPLEKEDWGTWKEGNTLNVGTYDENGNRVIKEYKLAGAEAESYADMLASQPQTQISITTQKLADIYKGPMSYLLNYPDGEFIKTTNPAYKKIGNGGMQCAEFVNRVTGTSFASGKAANTDAPNTLQVGSIASWMPNGAGEYGHAGIIVGEEGDNWIIKSANLRGNGIISVDSVPKSAIKGGHTPKAVKDMPMEVSGVYDTNQDKNLTPIGSNAEGGLFYDNTTRETITGKEAEAMYGQKIQGETGVVTDINSLGQYMKDNQPLGPGYSEKDVERFDAKIDRYMASGDTKSMAKAYRDMLLRDTDFKKEFDNTQKFTQALDDVSAMIKQYETAGKSTNAMKAMAEKVARKLGVTTDTALAQLQTQMGFTLANYIRSISGTAASDVEVQRLMGNMASIGNVDELNTALVEQARNNADASLKSMVDTRMYGLPEDLKPLVFGDIYTATTPTATPQATATGQKDSWKID